MVRIKTILLIIFAIFGGVTAVISPYTLAGVKQSDINDNKIDVTLPEYEDTITITPVTDPVDPTPVEPTDPEEPEQPTEHVYTYSVENIVLGDGTLDRLGRDGQNWFKIISYSGSGKDKKFIVESIPVNVQISYDFVTYKDGVKNTVYQKVYNTKLSQYESSKPDIIATDSGTSGRAKITLQIWEKGYYDQELFDKTGSTRFLYCAEFYYYDLTTFGGYTIK